MGEYPDTRGFGYSQSGVELRLDRRIFTTFKLTHNQAIEEGIIFGAAPEPLIRTRGQLQMGEGSIETEDLAEAQDFIDHLGDGFSDVLFNILVRYTSPTRPAIKRELVSCRVLDVEEDPGDGTDGVQSSFPISFMYRTFNGKKPLRNQRV